MGIILSQSRSERQIHPSGKDKLCSKCENFRRISKNEICDECCRKYCVREMKKTNPSWICKSCEMINEMNVECCIRCGRDSINKVRFSLKIRKMC